MRKVRDFDAELKSLNDRAKLLRSRKIQQFGELIEATGADALEPDLLAGALLGVVAEKDKAITMGNYIRDATGGGYGRCMRDRPAFRLPREMVAAGSYRRCSSCTSRAWAALSLTGRISLTSRRFHSSMNGSGGWLSSPC